MINLWDNPIYDIEDRLEFATGAYEFERKVNERLRERVKELEEELGKAENRYNNGG